MNMIWREKRVQVWLVDLFYSKHSFKKMKKNKQECRILPIIATIAKITQEQDVILLGDFNCIPPASIIKKKVGYVSLFHENEYTNTVNNKCFDNILIHSSLRIKHYCTHSVADIEVCTEGDPKSIQKKRKKVSDHRPILADFV